MSRSGYVDEPDSQWQLIRWRGMVASAIRGQRGQQFFRDLLIALDEMPDKRLIEGDLEKDGEVCTMGSLGRARGLDMSKIDPEVPEDVAAAFNIAACLASEVAYMNDEWLYSETPEQRWKRMREWVAKRIKEAPASAKPAKEKPQP